MAPKGYPGFFHEKHEHRMVFVGHVSRYGYTSIVKLLLDQRLGDG